MQIPEAHQVKLVAYKLHGSASVRWEQSQSTHKQQGKQLVRTWLKMKKLIMARLLPPDYEQILYQQYLNFEFSYSRSSHLPYRVDTVRGLNLHLNLISLFIKQIELELK